MSTINAQVLNPAEVLVSYVDSTGGVHTQPISDITIAGTLIDPHTGDDMEIQNVVLLK